MRKALSAGLLVVLLAGCGTPAPISSGTAPVESPSVPPETTVRALDPHSRQLLDRARSAGEQTVIVLVLAKPGAAAEAVRALTGLGAKVLSSNGPTGSLRAEVPTAVVAQVASLPLVTSVQLDEDIKREEPTP
jgi:hypothetical protein